jgi:hypothetical protein
MLSILYTFHTIFNKVFIGKYGMNKNIIEKHLDKSKIYSKDYFLLSSGSLFPSECTLSGGNLCLGNNSI